MGYWTATWLLTVKNFRLLWRRPGSLLVVVIASIAAMLVLFLLQRGYNRGDGVPQWALKNIDPEPYSLDTIPRCIPYTFADCITLAYVPSGSPSVKNWVETVARKNGIPLANETKGFRDSDALNKYLVANPNRTQAAYIFEAYNLDEIGNNSVSFIVQYNLTDQSVFPMGTSSYNTEVVVPAMIHAMNKVLMPDVGGVNVNINLKASIYPHPFLFDGDNAFLQIGAFLLFSIYFLVLVTFLVKMTEEKEQGLRDAMRLAGMSQSQHYISWGLPMFVLMFAVTLVLVALGNAFQFKFFHNTAFVLYFITFFTFSLALFGWTFFLAAFVKQTRTVSNVSFLIFIFMYMIGTFTGIVYFEKENGEPLLAEQSLYWREVFATIPSTMFIRCIGSIAFVTARDFRLNWADAGIYPTTYSLRTCWLWMLGSGAVAYVLSIYFDNVLPSPHGSPLSPLYLFQASYWKGVFSRTHGMPSLSKDVSPAQSDGSASESELASRREINPSDSLAYDPQEEDPAVRREREQIFRGGRDGDPLVIKNIVRRFKSFTAVDGVSLSVPRNTAFACLGHNGAGKSTLFKMLVTSIGVTEGDAFVYGHSVRDSLSDTRRILGVCQQHDALWDLLSGAEHIELFAALKGLDREQRESEMEERLVDVGLGEFADRPAGAYSGGMQRRLSVAISLTGNPRILLLDEFSTGADPLVRRDLWATIERAKKDRVVFIITHSMAEAERLGDNIGIMSKGKLRVLGTSLYLKNKFGAGYRVVVKLAGSTAESLAEKLAQVCPGSTMIDAAPAQNGNDTVLAQYSLPRRSSDKNVLNVMRMLEERREELGVLEFSLDSAPLDQVFKSITALSEDVVEPDFTEKKGCLSCFGNSRNLEQ